MSIRDRRVQRCSAISVFYIKIPVTKKHLYGVVDPKVSRLMQSPKLGWKACAGTAACCYYSTVDKQCLAGRFDLGVGPWNLVTCSQRIPAFTAWNPRLSAAYSKSGFSCSLFSYSSFVLHGPPRNTSNERYAQQMAVMSTSACGKNCCHVRIKYSCIV